MELDYWTKLNKQQPLLNIKSELFRVANWQPKDTNRFQDCLTRALDLIGTSFNDKSY